MLSKIQQVILAHISAGLTQKRISLLVSENEMNALTEETDKIMSGGMSFFSYDHKNIDAPVTLSYMGYTIHLMQV